MSESAFQSNAGRRPLQVLSLPRYEGSNPYVANLNAALAKQGAQVLTSRHGLLLSHLRCLLSCRTVPDILHQQWVHLDTLRATLWRSVLATLAFFLQLLVLRVLGVRIVWTLHNRTNHLGQFPRLDNFVRRAMCRFSAAVIVHSEEAQREMGRWLELPPALQQRFHVVPHASYTGCYPQTLSRTEARTVFGLTESHFCFGFAGRLQAYKGVENLVGAFRQLEGTQFRLLIAGQPGSPAFRRWMEEQRSADSRIILALHRIPDNELQACFQAMDGVVFPFREQLTSGSVLMAASFGRALVLPRIGSILEGLPSEGRVTFTPGDVGALRAAMKELSGRDVTAMGAMNRTAMESSEMSWETMARRTLAIYQSVLKRLPIEDAPSDSATACSKRRLQPF